MLNKFLNWVLRPKEHKVPQICTIAISDAGTDNNRFLIDIEGLTREEFILKDPHLDHDKRYRIDFMSRDRKGKSYLVLRLDDASGAAPFKDLSK